MEKDVGGIRKSAIFGTRSEIEIISGRTSKIKKIEVVGEAEKIEKRINEEIASPRSQ